MNYDFEIKGYYVEWKINGKKYRKDEFGTGEEAVKFARQKLKIADSVVIIKESYATGWNIITIEEVIKKIESLYNCYTTKNDSGCFTVDYDSTSDGIYCNYVPNPNDWGHAVSGDLLCVSETAQDDLKKLKDWLEEKRIFSRSGCEWDYFWGYKE